MLYFSALLLLLWLGRSVMFGGLLGLLEAWVCIFLHIYQMWCHQCQWWDTPVTLLAIWLAFNHINEIQWTAILNSSKSKNASMSSFSRNTLVLKSSGSVQDHLTVYYHMHKPLWQRHVAEFRCSKRTCLTGWWAVKSCLRAARTARLEIQKQISLFISYRYNDTHFNRRSCLLDIKKNRWQLNTNTLPWHFLTFRI